MSDKQYNRFRIVQHFSMGLFYILIGVLLTQLNKMGMNSWSPGFTYTFAAIIIIYGLFRITRGVVEVRK